MTIALRAVSVGLALACLSPAAHAQTTTDSAEISSLISTQIGIGKSFARAQASRVHERIEVLRGATDRQTSGYAIEIKAPSQLDGEDALSREWRQLEQGVPASALLTDVPWRKKKQDSLLARRKFTDEGYALWSSGSVDLARDNNGMVDIDTTTAGIVAGFDAELSKKTMLGFGLSFDRAIGEAGSFETEARASAYGVSLYGSYNPSEHTFLDAAGYLSWLDYSNARYLPGTRGYNFYGRSAVQLGASVSFGYEYRDDRFLISPYGRLETARSSLDSVPESFNTYDVLIGQQTVNSLLAVIAVRGEYTMQFDDVVVRPGLRAELTHDVLGANEVAIAANGDPDAMESLSFGNDSAQLMLAPEVRTEFAEDWELAVQYRNVINSSSRNETFKVGINYNF